MTDEVKSQVKSQLSEEDEKVLSNRYYAMRDRARKSGFAVDWESFSEYAEDVLRICPDDFTIRDYRIVFDEVDKKGYSVDTMRFVASPQKRAQILRDRYVSGQAIEEVRPKPNLRYIPLEKRILFAAELATRLCNFQVDETFDQLVAEAAVSAGIGSLPIDEPQTGDENG